jgi:Flp pilus assembly pilin Flp
MSARFRGDSRGAAAVEFALVAPVFFTLLATIFDLGQMVYGKALLSGAVQQAARDSSLETANTATADSLVAGMVRQILPDATVTGTRTSYYDFTDIGRPERWNDTNNDATCDNREAYVDENRNGAWDRDVGVRSNGGAGDVVIYSVTVDYKPLFRVPFAPGSWNRATLRAAAVRKNQPFAKQTGYGSGAGTCV